jgi:hypothetical protein
MAAQVADDLEHHVLPFWGPTVDGRRGGYVIERAGAPRRRAIRGNS